MLEERRVDRARREQGDLVVARPVVVDGREQGRPEPARVMVGSFIAIAATGVLLPLPLAAGALLAAAAASLLLASWLGRRLGGCTGDTLGAVQQTAEIAFLLAVVSRH